jgi:hypothetical protein
MLGEGGAHEIPAIMGQNDHHVEQPKRRGRHNEHIDRSDAFDVIQEAAPARKAPRRRSMDFATVAWLTSMPSLSSSPWIRGAPQSALALLI